MSLALNMAMALDPARLFEAAFGAPDPHQLPALRATTRRQLWNWSRQIGKSTTGAAIATHGAVFRGWQVLILSPSLRQSGELFRKCLDCYRVVADDAPADAEARSYLELAGGGRIVSLPAKEGTIRGFSKIDLLLITEASRVLDEIYHAVRPMLAVSDGRLIAESTPAGKRGWWSQAWHDLEQQWLRLQTPVYECARISREFVAEERRALGEILFAQEYLCQFLDPVNQLFGSDLIEGAASDAIETLFSVDDLRATLPDLFPEAVPSEALFSEAEFLASLGLEVV